MIPGALDLIGSRAIYKGDTWDPLSLIALPDLSSRGRPATLSGATVRAQTRGENDVVLQAFDVTIVNAALRQIKLTMTPTKTAALPITSSSAGSSAGVFLEKVFWDLEVAWGSYTDTILRGRVMVLRDETR